MDKNKQRKEIVRQAMSILAGKMHQKMRKKLGDKKYRETFSARFKKK